LQDVRRGTAPLRRQLRFFHVRPALTFCFGSGSGAMSGLPILSRTNGGYGGGNAPRRSTMKTAIVMRLGTIVLVLVSVLPCAAQAGAGGAGGGAGGGPGGAPGGTGSPNIGVAPGGPGTSPGRTPTPDPGIGAQPSQPFGSTPNTGTRNQGMGSGSESGSDTGARGGTGSRRSGSSSGSSSGSPATPGTSGAAGGP